MCLAQGQNAVTLERFENAAARSQVKTSTTEPLRSHLISNKATWQGLELRLINTGNIDEK